MHRIYWRRLPSWSTTLKQVRSTPSCRPKLRAYVGMILSRLLLALTRPVSKNEHSNQIVHIDLERLGDAFDDRQRRFPCATLDLREVRLADAGLVRQLLLHETAIVTPNPHRTVSGNEAIHYFRRHELLDLHLGAIVRTDIVKVLQFLDHPVIGLFGHEHEPLAALHDNLMAHW